MNITMPTMKKKAISLALTFALALTLTPAPQALAAEADSETVNETQELTPVDAGRETINETQALTPVNAGIKMINLLTSLESSGIQLASNSIPVIGITAPVGGSIGFGKSGAYDVATKTFSSTGSASVTSDITFQNTGTAYARLKNITCTDNGASTLLAKTDGSAIDDTCKIFNLSNNSSENLKNVSFGPIGGTSGANAVGESELGVAFDIPDQADATTSGEKTFTYTLDLSTAPVKYDAVSAGTATGVAKGLANVTYTFETATTTITWDANGGTFTEGKTTTTTSEICSSDAKITSFPSEPTTTQEGYEFLGWFDALEGGNAVTSGATLPHTAETVTYYAHWGVPFFLAPANSSDPESEMIKTATKIKADSALIAEGDTTTKATYESYMTNDNPHLYTKLVGTDGTATNDWVECRIVGLNHDIDASGYPVGLTFQAIHSLPTAYQMNSTGTNTGGWRASLLRDKMNPDSGDVYNATTDDTIWDLFDSNFTRQLVPVQKSSGLGSGESGVCYTTDALWLMSYMELVPTCYSSWSSLNVAKERTDATAPANQYTYWNGKVTNNDGSNTALAPLYKKRDGTSSAASGWERSAYPSNTNGFLLVNASGYPNLYNRASYSFGVVPCFCL